MSAPRFITLNWKEPEADVSRKLVVNLDYVALMLPCADGRGTELEMSHNGATLAVLESIDDIYWLARTLT